MRLTTLVAMAFAGALLVSSATAQAPFTVVALPDTQNYVTSSSNAPLFTQQTQWIADQIQVDGNPRNIQFVTHLGDMVSDGDSLTQLDRADASMSVLDGVVPYGVLPGNHDYASTGDKLSGVSDYVDYFGPSRFAGEDWYGGADPSGTNSYQRFSAGGYDFLHLSLEWIPTSNQPFRETSPIEWAQSVLDANPDTPVILSTHENLDDSPAGRSGAGQAMWDELVRFNDQIFMVLNGHYHSVGGTNDGEYHQIGINDAGRPVFEVLQDYQDYPNGGDGWLRLIEFDVPNDTIRFETYSPVLDAFQTETVAQVGAFASQFEFDVDFADRLSPVFIEPPPAPREPDLVFQQGLNGYSGTLDKEIRSSGGDSSNGGNDTISVDGDDGSPDLQPNHGLIRFEDLIGGGALQIPADAQIDQALLVLEVENQGSGFQVHEMLVDWDESDTWSSLGSGVQDDGVEAVATPVDAVGASNSSSNVPVGALEIDVTESIAAYLDGSLENLGWALIPYAAGTNGIDFYTSEFSVVGLRPMLQVFLTPVVGDYNGDRVVDASDYLAWRDAFGVEGDSPADGNGDGVVDAADYTVWRDAYSAAAAPVAVPCPSSLALLLGAGVLPIGPRRRRLDR